MDDVKNTNSALNRTSSKKGSNISLLESEFSLYTPTHNYYTRLSARLSQTSLFKGRAKRAYIDLSNSKFDLLDSDSPRKPCDDNKDKDKDSDILDELSEESARSSVVLYGQKIDSLKEESLKNLRQYFGMDLNSRSRGSARSGGARNYDSSCIGETDNSIYFTLGALLVAVALVIIPASHLMNNLKKDLGRIKEEVNNVKCEMKTVTEEKEEAKSKLDALENILTEMKNKQDQTNETDPEEENKALKRLIKAELEEREKEKMGRTDYALESAGGRIVQLVDTENFDTNGKKLLGFKICDGGHGPIAMIQPGTAPGQCWAFKGHRGSVIIKLLGPVKIDAVSIEHIPTQISPSGSISSAPKDFQVKGLSSCEAKGGGFLLGNFAYDANGPPLQTFDLTQPAPMAFMFVEFNVLSNHGNPDFTCVYRFQVHGTLENNAYP